MTSTFKVTAAILLKTKTELKPPWILAAVYTHTHSHSLSFKVQLVQNNPAVIFCSIFVRAEADICGWAMPLKRAPRLIMQSANAPGIHPRPEIFVLKLFNAEIKVDDLYSVAPARGPPWANLISYQQNGWGRSAAAWWDEARGGTLLSRNYLRLD